MRELDEFFSDHEWSRRLFDIVATHVERAGAHVVRVSKSQVAFARRRTFALAWVPEMHLGRPAAPLVLSVLTRFRMDSPRWKEVVEPRPGRFTHHLEIHDPDDVDDEVDQWLRAAWQTAG